MSLTLVDYDRDFLERSWRWLSDPEIRELTMTPPFTKQEQQAFYESLATRADYWIWGIEIDGEKVGAAGLKNPRNGSVEYWGYLGEKAYWGRGLGAQMVKAVEQQAAQLGFDHVYLRVTSANVRAIRLYRSLGYAVNDPGEVIEMQRRLSDGG